MKSKDDNLLSVSIIIPVYNDYTGLDRTLGDINNAIATLSITDKMNSIQVVVIDDGSQCDYADLIKVYGSKFKLLYYKQQNGRQGKARNTGLKFSECNYVWFVDADDQIPVGALTHIVNAIAFSPYSDIIFFSASVYDRIYMPSASYMVNYADRDSRLLGAADNRLVIAPWSKVYRRQFLLENDIKFPEKLKYEDLYFSVVTLACAKFVACSDDIIYHYIFNAFSTTKVHDSSLLDVFFVLTCIFDKTDYTYPDTFMSRIIYTHGVKYTLRRLIESLSLKLAIEVLSNEIFFTSLNDIRYKHLNLLQRPVLFGAIALSNVFVWGRRLYCFVKRIKNVFH